MEASGLDRSAIARLAWTPERREALRQKRLGPLNPMFGKKLPESTIKKRSATYSSSCKAKREITPEVLAQLRANGLLSKWRAPTLKQYLITDEEYKAQMAAGNRWCCHKKHFAPDADFERPKGRGGVCKSCGPAYARKRKLSREYGVTPEWFEAKLKEQGGCCALCHKTFDLHSGLPRNLCVDHDHGTGKPRGILCRRCNSSLERAEKIPDWIEKALMYLKQYGSAVA